MNRVSRFLLAAPLSFAALGSARPGDNDLLATLPREERVRILKQRTWEMTAVRIQGGLHIDGHLDEPAWSLAPPITDFYQGESNEGLPATEDTEVRALYDDRNLYIGFRCYDQEPHKAMARAIFRDEAPSADDAAMLMLDAFNDHRSAIQLLTNMNGIQLDLLQNGETTETRNRNWDTVWSAGGSRTPDGWEAEMAIPFKSLRFPPGAPGEEIIFGIGFKRNIPRKNEEVTWPFVSNDSTWYRPAELGHLRGLRDIKPGRNIELRPYALGGVDRDVPADRRDGRAEIGGDLKWGVTSGLTADVSINTDFAQEEADIQQINFTRFSLRFPEKRQFFLEGERMFQFGLPNEAELIFTRRIGLSNEGDVLPTRAGGRLTGRQGAYTIGAMNIQTGEAFDLPAENFTALRLRRDILARSTVGAVFTNRQGRLGYNRLYGADINLYLRQAWTIESFVAHVDDPEWSTGRDAVYGRVGYDSDLFGVSYRFLDLDENFRPGLGFVRRPDSKESLGELRFSPRPATDWIRQFHFRGLFRYITNHRDVFETRERGTELETDFESGDSVKLTYSSLYEFIDEPFSINEVPIPPGFYRFSRYGVELDTFRRRHTSLQLRYETGRFWDGTRDQLAMEASYRVNKNFDFNGGYTVNWVDLASGSLTTHLASARIQIVFTKDIVLMSLLQYNSTTHQLSSNIRFNWIPNPGSDFFIVYNEADDWDKTFLVRNRSLAVKLNYWFAL